MIGFQADQIDAARDEPLAISLVLFECFFENWSTQIDTRQARSEVLTGWSDDGFRKRCHVTRPIKRFTVGVRIARIAAEINKPIAMPP